MPQYLVLRLHVCPCCPSFSPSLIHPRVRFLLTTPPLFPLPVCIRMKDGIEITRDLTRYRMKKDGKKHMLVIGEATKDDIGGFTVFTNGGHSEAELDVEGRVVTLWDGISGPHR